MTAAGVDGPFSLVSGTTPVGCERSEIREVFEEFGPLHGEGVRFPVSLKDQKFWIDYKNFADANKALKALNEKPCVGLGGFKLRLQWEQYTRAKLMRAGLISQEEASSAASRGVPLPVKQMPAGPVHTKAWLAAQAAKAKSKSSAASAKVTVGAESSRSKVRGSVASASAAAPKTIPKTGTPRPKTVKPDQTPAEISKPKVVTEKAVGLSNLNQPAPSVRKRDLGTDPPGFDFKELLAPPKPPKRHKSTLQPQVQATPSSSSSNRQNLAPKAIATSPAVVKRASTPLKQPYMAEVKKQPSQVQRVGGVSSPQKTEFEQALHKKVLQEAFLPPVGSNDPSADAADDGSTIGIGVLDALLGQLEAEEESSKAAPVRPEYPIPPAARPSQPTTRAKHERLRKPTKELAEVSASTGAASFVSEKSGTSNLVKTGRVSAETWKQMSEECFAEMGEALQLFYTFSGDARSQYRIIPKIVF